MKIFILLILIVNIFNFNLRSTKQEYDSYVMAVQWPNGNCKAYNCYGKDANVYKNKLTIHGLWPSLKSGKYLLDCTSGVNIVDDGSDLFKDMKQYWPTLSKNTNEYFWGHEYNKHGFCMVEERHWLDYNDYFSFVLGIHKRFYNDLLSNAFPNRLNETFTITYDEMKKAIQKVVPNATFQMLCKNNYIKEFYFYLEKDVITPAVNYNFNNTCKSALLVFK